MAAGGWVWQSADVKRAKRPDRRLTSAVFRYGTRRDGGAAITLFLLPWIVALAMLRLHRHVDDAAVAAMIAFSVGLPPIWLGWAAYRGPRQSESHTSGLGLAQVADQLAIAVGSQWEAEADLRRLNDPYPLPVSWTAADASFTDSWDLLMRMAIGTAGEQSALASSAWAGGPDDLAGNGRELVEVLAKVPTRRLVVLGEPGAGKTMLLIRLVLDLLARRVSGGPVPVLVSVASWNPTVQDLKSWLTAQILTDYPTLAGPSSIGGKVSSQAVALLTARLILPILDGLDEIPEDVRGPAISRINDALQPGEQIVIACRTQQYQDAVRPQGGSEVTLRAAAVELRPLDADTVRRYLCDDAAGPVMRSRWDPVLALLGTDAPVGHALRTPLMVSLARMIYNPRPGELVEGLRDPAEELCQPDLADHKAVEALLFDAFIPAAYRHDANGLWNARNAEKWLVFLAGYLERRIGRPDLAWWQLPLAVPGFAIINRILNSAILGIFAGFLFWFSAGPVAGIVGGLFAAIVVPFTFPVDLPTPIRAARMRRPKRSTVLTGVGIGIVVAVAGYVVGGKFGLKVAVGWILLGASAGIVIAILAWLMSQTGDPLEPTSASSPPVALLADRRAGFVLATPVGILSGTVFGLISGGLAGPEVGIVIGIVVGILFGAANLFSTAAWPSFEIARIFFSLCRWLPWPLIDFLSDAHKRGILRQVGAVYQFRHIELQHRLANRNTADSNDRFHS